MSSSNRPRRDRSDDAERADPLTKADPALRVALGGEPDATVRAVLVLRDPKASDVAVPDELDPDDYANRRAWRVAQIEAQRELIEARYGTVLADMRDRGLVLVGGTMTPVVVVTGEAAAVRDALRYDVVASATFEPLS